MEEAVPYHDNAPCQDDAAQEPSWTNLPRKEGAKGLKDGVCREKGEDYDRVTRAYLELEFLIKPGDTGRGEIKPVHE